MTEPIFTVPNLLTVLRMTLAPFLVAAPRASTAYAMDLDGACRPANGATAGAYQASAP